MRDIRVHSLAGRTNRQIDTCVVVVLRHCVSAPSFASGAHSSKFSSPMNTQNNNICEPKRKCYSLKVHYKGNLFELSSKQKSMV